MPSHYPDNQSEPLNHLEQYLQYQPHNEYQYLEK